MRERQLSGSKDYAARDSAVPEIIEDFIGRGEGSLGDLAAHSSIGGHGQHFTQVLARAHCGCLYTNFRTSH